MPSENTAVRKQASRRGGWRLLLAACATTALAACAQTGATRPATPTYSGAMRPEPTRPDRPGEPMARAAVANPAADSRSAYRPRHIPGNEMREIQRVAVLLPFSASDPQVRKTAEGLFNAVEMSLFEVNAPNVVLMPRDASGDAAQVAEATRQAIEDGAVAVIGPVFAQQVAPVAQEAGRVRAPVLAFSTDPSALGTGAYLVSLTPRAEVQRIVGWAASQGITRIAMFGPNTNYGRSVEQALREEAAKRSMLVIGAEFYSPGDTTPQEPARKLATAIKRENTASPGKVAVLIPERGVQLRSVASLLPYFDVDTRQVKFLGTSAWNDPSVLREPSLFGGVFVAPDPNAVNDFSTRYRAAFGEAPVSITSYGYDAGALAATLAKVDRLDRGMIERPEGWSGVNGLFRFLEDGGAERALAVMQVQNGGGATVIAPAAQAFGSDS